jgi:hypothetical protein
MLGNIDLIFLPLKSKKIKKKIGHEYNGKKLEHLKKLVKTIRHFNLRFTLGRF